MKSMAKYDTLPLFLALNVTLIALVRFLMHG